MKKVALIALALLLVLPAAAKAQDSVPEAPSLKEIRQRAGYALSRADNLQQEIAAAIEHLIRLRAMADSAVTRDSVLELRPDSGGTDTVRVTTTDTVRVAATDSTPPDPPGRPIGFSRLDSTSVEVSWQSAGGARWYHWQSSVGTGFSTDTAAVLDLAPGDWICLWAANAAGQNPAGSGVCTSADSAIAYQSVTLDYAATQDLLVSPDSVWSDVGDTTRFVYANLVRRGDSTIVGCVGSCWPFADSIRPALYRDGIGYWMGTPTVPDAPRDAWGFYPMSMLDSIIARQSAT